MWSRLEKRAQKLAADAVDARAREARMAEAYLAKNGKPAEAGEKKGPHIV